MKKTFLNKYHHENGGHMVDFSGWEMPINYGSQISEHLSVRENVGMFDVSHMAVFDLDGNEQLDFLKSLLPNDVSKIVDKKRALYSPLLNHDGGILDDLIVYHLGGLNFRIISNCATRDQNLNWFNEISSGFDVAIDFKSDYSIIAIQGPSSQSALGNLLKQELQNFHLQMDNEIMIARTGYTGEIGFEIVSNKTIGQEIWSEFIKLGVKPVGLAARDTLRLEAGYNLYGIDMSIQNNPYDSNLSWTIDLSDDKRDFIGKKALERNKKSDEILCGFYTEERGVLRSGMEISFKNGGGVITSGTWSPTFKKNIGLCRISANHPEKGTALLRDKEVNLYFCETNFLKYLK